MDGVTGDAAPAVAATLNCLAPESRRNRLYVALGGHMTTTRYAPATVTITNARPHGLWRAFSPPPQDWPLGLLDYRSADDAEGEPNLLLFV